MGIDQTDVIPVFFSQKSSDLETEGRSRSRCLDCRKSNVSHQSRFMPEEKLFNQRAYLLIANFPTVNRSRRGNCFAMDLFANWRYTRLLRSWRFGEKPKSIHWTTTSGRPIEKMRGCVDVVLGAGSHASTGTSSTP